MIAAKSVGDGDGAGTAEATPPLPPGTDVTCVGSWEESSDTTFRLCWSPPIPLPDRVSHLDIRAVVEQRPDGVIAKAPSVYLADHGWSVPDARLIGRALLGGL